MDKKKESEKTSNKRLFINMAANIVSYAGTIFISFILTPYLITTIGKEAYSFYPMANSFVNYMSIVVNALNAVANRYISISIVEKKNEEANRYFSSTFFSNLLMSSILLVPMLIVIIFIDKILNVPINLIAAVRILFSFTFASMLVNISTAVFGVATYATNRVDLRSYRELIAAICRILLFLVIFSLCTPNLAYIGIIAFIVAILNLVIQVIYTKKLVPDLIISKKYFSINYIKTILKSGTWNVLNQLGNMMLSGSTLLLANILCGAEAGGDYSIIQTVPAFINGIISMLVGVFAPIMMHHYATKDINSLLNEVKKAQMLIGIVCCSVIAVFIGLSMEFFQLWVPTENARYLSLISAIAIIPHVIISSVWPISNLNVIIDKLKVPAIYLLVSGLLNIVGAILSCRVYGGDLIILVMICSIIQVVWTLFFIPIYPCKYFKISRIYFYPIVIATLIGTVIGVVVTIYIKHFFIIESWIMLFTVGIVCGIVTIIIQTLLVMSTKWIPYRKNTNLDKKN